MIIELKCSERVKNFLIGSYGNTIQLPNKKDAILDYMFLALWKPNRTRDKRLIWENILTETVDLEITKKVAQRRRIEVSLSNCHEIDRFITRSVYEDIRRTYLFLSHLQSSIKLMDVYRYFIDFHNLDPDLWKYDTIQTYINRSDKKMTEPNVRKLNYNNGATKFPRHSNFRV